MEGEKKKSKKKWIVLGVFAVLAIIIAVIVIIAVSNVGGGSKFAQENLNGKWNVVTSVSGRGKNSEGEYVDCKLGSTVEFDTSNGLDDGNTLIKMTINGKQYIEKITVRPTVKEGTVISMNLQFSKEANLSPTVTCLSDGVYFISGLATSSGESVGGTVIAKDNIPFNAEQLKGSFEFEREGGGTGNNSSALGSIGSAVIENDKITLKVSGKEEQSTLTVSEKTTEFSYKVGDNSVVGKILETNEKYIILCVSIGNGERYSMVYKLARV